MSNDPRATPAVLNELLCVALGVGVVLIALVPAARGMSVIGWLPMWLIAMPAAAWCALRLASASGSTALREVRARGTAARMNLSRAHTVVQARRLRAAPTRRGPARHAA